MKKPLVSALTAALTFAACDDAQTPPVVHLPAPEPVIVVTAVRPVSASEPDSGTPLVQAPPPAPVDPLALAHERPGVDHLRLARQLLDDGDVRGALAEARRALFSSPDDTEVLELIATLGRQASQPSLSADAWGRIAAQRSTDAIPSIKQARAHLQAKDFTFAIAAGQEAARRDLGNPEAFQVTGLAQLASGDLTGAIASFRTVVGLQPDHGHALNNLGLAYLRANRNDEAVEVLEAAIEHLPTVAYVHNNLGVAYERVGRGADARAAYQEAMDLSPKYVKARLNAARVARGTVALDAAEEADVMSDVPHPLAAPRVDSP